ncbi:unnamed protein product [Staurois parvus]|uniref:T-cell leukemia homeobox protein 3 n=1 Tax=Staurois parvus TaxID=386267 RepID=A0ABN9D5M1_9NEOB|nr:unnamed protein product [Staurois parvus]
MDQPTSTQTQHQHEPISFGIDQILNNSEQENSAQVAPRPSDNANYLSSPISRSSAPYSSLPASFPGIGAAFEDSGSYSVNLSLAPAGVIRVPAHRPIPGAVPPPISSAIPAMPAVPGLGSLNFPWMESSRRFVKERFSGHPYQNRTPPKRKKTANVFLQSPNLRIGEAISSPKIPRFCRESRPRQILENDRRTSQDMVSKQEDKMEETDSRREGSGETTGEQTDAAAAARCVPEVAQRLHPAGPVVFAQFFFICTSESAALGGGSQQDDSCHLPSVRKRT